MTEGTDGYHELTAAELTEWWRPKTALEFVTIAAQESSDVEYTTPDAALRWLLQCAWCDLQDARRRAIDGVWSIECETVVARIVGLTRLVDPQRWESVPVELILDGLYERLHETIGCPTPLSGADRARAQAVMDRRRETP
jgi:hypothetical protein